MARIKMFSIINLQILIKEYCETENIDYLSAPSSKFESSNNLNTNFIR